MTYEEATSRCWAEIDLDVLLGNYRQALAMLKPGVRLIAVLKANAYGLGSVPVARTLWQAGARFFAVAAVNEAEELARAIPGIDVLVMGLAGRAQLKGAMERGVKLTVFTLEQAKEISRAAQEMGAVARVHVKLETGLHRLGFEPEGAPEKIKAVAGLPGIHLEGLYTHLALRNRESDRKQFETIHGVYHALEEMGVHIDVLHALDSIGMVRYPEEQMDAVRTGAWLYGVCPNGYDHPERCRMPMTLKTRVAQLHYVSAGECLGYDENHPLERDSLIATLSAGYIDGYPRLNNLGQVEIRGRRADVRGLVCMDQMMVDVTDIDGVAEGDEVILIGGGIGVNEYAEWGKLNRNEALARVNRRVPRVYYQGGQMAEIVDYMETVL